jgi:hypothetical protein
VENIKKVFKSQDVSSFDECENGYHLGPVGVSGEGWTVEAGCHNDSPIDFFTRMAPNSEPFNSLCLE